MTPYPELKARWRGADRGAFLRAVEEPHLVLWTELNAAEDAERPTAAFLTIATSAQALAAQAGPIAALPVVKRPGANAFGMMITLGRAPNNDLVLADRRISKFHCYLRRLGAQWVVSDASSTNGTQVDQVAVPRERSVPLRSGARLTLGGSVELEFLEPPDLYERLRAP